MIFTIALLVSTITLAANLPSKPLVVKLANKEILEFATDTQEYECSGERTPSKCKPIHNGTCTAQLIGYFGKASETLNNIRAKPPTLPALPSHENLTFEGHFFLEGGQVRYISNGINHLGEVKPVKSIEFQLKHIQNKINIQIKRIQKLVLRTSSGQSFNMTNHVKIKSNGIVKLDLSDFERTALMTDGKEVIYDFVADCFSLAPNEKRWEFPLFTDSRLNLGSAGKLEVRVEQGRKILYFFKDPNNKFDIPFFPDMSEVEYGHGFQIYHTTLEEKSGWALLPTNPFPNPVWIYQLGEVKSLPISDTVFYFKRTAMGMRKDRGQTEAIPFRVFVISELGPKGVVIEEENPSVPCKDSKTNFSGNSYTVPYSELYDQSQHLVLGFARTRHCR